MRGGREGERRGRRREWAPPPAERERGRWPPRTSDTLLGAGRPSPAWWSHQPCCLLSPGDPNWLLSLAALSRGNTWEVVPEELMPSCKAHRSPRDSALQLTGTLRLNASFNTDLNRKRMSRIYRFAAKARMRCRDFPSSSPVAIL